LFGCLTNTVGIMDKASFSLLGYYFDRVMIDFQNRVEDKQWAVEIKPSGLYNVNTGEFHLQFYFAGKLGNQEKAPKVETQCKALFKFASPLKFEDIPSYFFANSIAIIFPYLRAFISTVTLQANLQPIILPTYNLSALKDALVEHTTIHQ